MSTQDSEITTESFEVVESGGHGNLSNEIIEGNLVNLYRDVHGAVKSHFIGKEVTRESLGEVIDQVVKSKWYLHAKDKEFYGWNRHRKINMPHRAFSNGILNIFGPNGVESFYEFWGEFMGECGKSGPKFASFPESIGIHDAGYVYPDSVAALYFWNKNFDNPEFYKTGKSMGLYAGFEFPCGFPIEKLDPKSGMTLLGYVFFSF